MCQDMRVAPLRAALSFAVALGLGADAHADPPGPIMHPGTQPVPPVRAGETVLPQELSGRRAIRGCSVAERCARPGAPPRGLGLGACAPAAPTPGLDDRTPPSSRLEPTPRPLVKRPSEL